MKNSVLTDRYAKALFKIALDSDLVDTFYQDLSSLTEVFNENPKLKEIFTHPRLSKADKDSIIDDFYQVAFENQHIKNFLHLLIQKKREKELEGIFDSFTKLYDDYKKQLPVEVVVANEITDEQIEKLRKKIVDKTKKEPIITISIDPQLLGGMIVKYEDKIIDGSVLKQVQQLTASIKDIPVAKLRGEVV
ncbi:MAG: ATP synthase F1 subunit delta [Clostridia bacterium]